LFPFYSVSRATVQVSKPQLARYGPRRSMNSASKKNEKKVYERLMGCLETCDGCMAVRWIRFVITVIWPLNFQFLLP